MPTNRKIAVLGAGPMGLAVAYQLALDGYKPIIFEADDRVGGMTATFDFEGLDIERYYHFHCTSDVDFLELLEELGISGKMSWVETKMSYWFQNQLQPWGNPIALLNFRGLSLTAKLRYGIHAFLSTKRNNWKPLDELEAVGWIKRWVGEEAYNVLWRRLFELKFYQYTRGLSAAWIWSRIRRIGRSRYSLFREKLGYLEGGSSTLLNALSDAIMAAGGEIRLGTPIQKVNITNGRITGVNTSSYVESFDTVISTIPLPFIGRLIPDLPDTLLDKYNTVKNIAVVCVIVKLQQKITDSFWLNVNDPEMDIPGIVEYSNLRPIDNHIAYVPFYMPGDHPKYAEENEVFIAKVKSYIKKINTNLSESDFIDIKVSRYRFAQPICDPGYLNKIPPKKLPIQGLWVADTSYYYPEDRGISESIGFGRTMARDSVA